MTPTDPLAEKMRRTVNLRRILLLAFAGSSVFLYIALSLTPEASGDCRERKFLTYIAPICSVAAISLFRFLTSTPIVRKVTAAEPDPTARKLRALDHYMLALVVALAVNEAAVTIGFDPR